MCVCVYIYRVFESIIIISVVSSWCVYCPHTHTHSLFKWKWENRFNFVRFPILSSIFLIRFKFRFRLMSTWEWTSSDICFSLSLILFLSQFVHFLRIFFHFTIYIDSELCKFFFLSCRWMDIWDSNMFLFPIECTLTSRNGQTRNNIYNKRYQIRSNTSSLMQKKKTASFFSCEFAHWFYLLVLLLSIGYMRFFGDAAILFTF